MWERTQDVPSMPVSPVFASSALHYTFSLWGRLMGHNQQTKLNKCSEPDVFVVDANGLETTFQALAEAWR